jgi:hypothetical protein
VGKNGPSHDCALALADAERFDLVLLQEPWTQAKDDRCLTKTHPAYDTYSPVDNWDGSSTRPRVMTYLRRDPALRADQLRPRPSRDLLWLHVNNTTIVNVYKDSDIQETVRILQDWQVPDRCVIARDGHLTNGKRVDRFIRYQVLRTSNCQTVTGTHHVNRV